MALLLIGCKFKKADIGDYQEIQNLFHQDEINDLKKILNFFDKVVCESENLNQKNIKNCYNQYFKRMKDNEKITGNFEIQIPYQEQEKLLNNLSPNTFDQIWKIYKTWKPRAAALEESYSCCR